MDEYQPRFGECLKRAEGAHYTSLGRNRAQTSLLVGDDAGPGTHPQKIKGLKARHKVRPQTTRDSNTLRQVSTFMGYVNHAPGRPTAHSRSMTDKPLFQPIGSTASGHSVVLHALGRRVAPRVGNTWEYRAPVGVTG